MKKKCIIAVLLGWAVQMMGGIPVGYYQGVDCKSASQLKDALENIIKNHKTLSYSKLWDYYPYTYYVIGNPQQVLDMYSNDVTYFSNTTGLNKEHTVPQSWWGKGTGSGPGCDIFNVIPSEQKANSAKSNYPLAKVNGQVTFDNGVTKVGKTALDGYSGNAFEPKDDYKGDFARIYFYVATCYPDLAWDTNNAAALTNQGLTLKDWIVPILLEWNAADPVDDAEIQRNEDIYKQQGNRNPFIDYPVLPEYIWGQRRGEEFVLADHTANEGETQEQKTLKPQFDIDYGTEDNPKNVVDGTVVKVKGGTSTSTLHTRVNGQDWVETACTTGWNAATETEYHEPATMAVTISGETLIEAYCTHDDYLPSDIVTAYYRGVDFDEDFLLHEEFDAITSGNNTSSQGSSAAWSGNVNFPEVTSVFCAGNAVKLGSGKATGKLVSRTLPTAGGTIQVELDVKGWTTVEGQLEVTLSGAESQTVAYTATMTDDFEHVSLTFEEVAANAVLTIATTTKRCFVDNISVTQASDAAVEQIRTTNTTALPIYNFHGQRVGNDYRGIVIVNGHKYYRK